LPVGEQLGLPHQPPMPLRRASFRTSPSWRACPCSEFTKLDKSFLAIGISGQLAKQAQGSRVQKIGRFILHDRISPVRDFDYSKSAGILYMLNSQAATRDLVGIKKRLSHEWESLFLYLTSGC